MKQPGKLSQGTRKVKTNNYFVYRYIFILKKKRGTKWVYKEIGKLVFLVP